MALQRHSVYSRRAGFTLVELLVVIAIIGLLSTFAVVALASAQQSARIAKARSDIDAIATAIQMLGQDTGEWPLHQAVDATCPGCADNEACGGGDCGARTISSGITGLTQNDGVTPYTNWRGPYMAVIPLDPWGSEYFLDTDYDVDPAAPVVWGAVVGSFGPDKDALNEYDDNDIIRRLR